MDVDDHAATGEFQHLLKEVQKCRGPIPIENFRSLFVLAGGDGEFDREVRRQHDCEGITRLLLTLSAETRRLVLAEVHSKRCPIVTPNNYQPFVANVDSDSELPICNTDGSNAASSTVSSAKEVNNYQLLRKYVQPFQATYKPEDIADFRDIQAKPKCHDRYQEILLCGDIERNPGPEYERQQCAEIEQHREETADKLLKMIHFIRYDEEVNSPPNRSKQICYYSTTSEIVYHLCTTDDVDHLKWPFKLKFTLNQSPIPVIAWMRDDKLEED